MRYSVRNTNRFDKDLIKCAKRGLPMKAIYDAIKILAEAGSLPAEYNPHKLTGNHAGKWECHINGRNSDWLMVWEQNDSVLTLLFLRTGSHSDLF